MRIVDIATVVIHDEFMSHSPSSTLLPVPAIRRNEMAARSARRAHRTASSARRDDTWNAGQRSETPLKRADRNFAELLQELRVAQTGVQILFAFLLGLAFTNRFATLGATERDTYIATLAASALTGALLVAPVMAHRLLFQRGFKRELVRIGHRFAVAGLCGLLAAIVGGLLLVLEVFFGGSAAVVTAAALAMLFASLWAGPALWVGHCHPRAHLPGQPPAVATAAPIVTSSNLAAAPRVRGTWVCDETGRLTLCWQLINPGETPSERTEIRLVGARIGKRTSLPRRTGQQTCAAKGRPEDGVAAVEEAVTFYRQHDGDSPRSDRSRVEAPAACAPPAARTSSSHRFPRKPEANSGPPLRAVSTLSLPFWHRCGLSGVRRLGRSAGVSRKRP